MASPGKRALASLFGIHLNEDAPKLTSLVPQRISNEIMTGQLPKFNPSNLMLGKNETCHFMDKAALVVKQKERSYRTHRGGSSYKVTKNWTWHSSNGSARPVDQEWYEYKEGVVFVTNQRIIFVAPENGFEKKLSGLTAIIPYSDAITMQFNGKEISLVMPQAQLMAQVIKMIN